MPGLVVQVTREAHLPDGADPPPFREDGLAGVDRGHPLLDRGRHAGPDRPVDAEAAVIVSPAFKDKRYAVLGLARSGLAAVETLLVSGAPEKPSC